MAKIANHRSPVPPCRALKYGAFGAALAMVLIGPSGPAEGAGQVTLSKAECQRLIGAPATYQPAPDVAYQPGVDARGNPVAGADVAGASPIKMPDEISFDIATDLEKKYGIGSSGVFSGEGTVGKVSFRGGQVYWNDQPLDGGDSAAVERACRSAYDKP